MSFGLGLLPQRTKAVVVKRDYIDRRWRPLRALAAAQSPVGVT